MTSLFEKLNRAFTTQIQIPNFRELEETDVEQAQQYADHWSTQKDRADRYTALMQKGTVDRAEAQAYFVERLAPLDSQVQGILKNAEVRALGAARKYSKLIKGAE